MNKVFIIGNLTKDPELRSTQTGKQVCTFTVAVNMRNDETEFIRVSVWNKFGEVCAKYLSKGKKVAVTGAVRARAYLNKKNEAVGCLEVTADDVEFLSQKGEESHDSPAPALPQNDSGFVDVSGDDDELPF